MKSMCFSVLAFVTILEIVNALSVPKEAKTAELVKPEVKQHFEAAPPNAVEMLPNHDMKRSLDHTEGPRSERYLGNWFGNRQPYYPSGRPYYNTNGYYPAGSGYYPGTGGYGGSYPSSGGGTNFLGSGYGGYGGFGGNGRLPTYYGYDAGDYYGNRNLGYGYYRRTNLDGMPGRQTYSSSYYSSRPSYDSYYHGSNGGYNNYGSSYGSGGYGSNYGSGYGSSYGSGSSSYGGYRGYD